MLGIVYGVVAAAIFGFNNASARRGVLTGTALQGLAISLPLGVLVFVLGATLTGEWDHLADLSGFSIFLFASAGFMHFAFGRYFNIRSLAAVGSNLSGPVQQLQHLVAITFAIIFLGESLSVMKIMGIFLILSAPTFILFNQAKKKAKKEALNEIEDKPKFTPRLVEGYICALLTAIGFGTSPVLVKAGLAGSNLSFLSGFISYVAAFLILSFALLIPSQLSNLKGLNKESFKWFMYSGVGSSFSQMFRYLALGVAPVTIVQPLQSLSLIFRMIFGHFLNRDHEEFDRYVVIGILLSFFGVLALTISSEFLMTHLNASNWVIELAKWSWP